MSEACTSLLEKSMGLKGFALRIRYLWHTTLLINAEVAHFVAVAGHIVMTIIHGLLI